MATTDLPNPAEYAQKFAEAVRERLQKTIVPPAREAPDSGFALEELPENTSMFRESLFLPDGANPEFPLRKILYKGNLRLTDYHPQCNSGSHSFSRHSSDYQIASCSIDNYGNFLIQGVYIVRNTIAYPESGLKLVKAVGVGALSQSMVINLCPDIEGDVVNHFCPRCNKPSYSQTQQHSCSGGHTWICDTDPPENYRVRKLSTPDVSQLPWTKLCGGPSGRLVGTLDGVERDQLQEFLTRLIMPLNESMRSFELAIRALGDPVDIPKLDVTTPLPAIEDPSASIALRDTCMRMREEFAKMVPENDALREELATLQDFTAKQAREHHETITKQLKEHQEQLCQFQSKHMEELLKAQSVYKEQLEKLEEGLQARVCTQKECHETAKQLRLSLGSDEAITAREKDASIAHLTFQVGSQKESIAAMRREAKKLSFELIHVQEQLESARNQLKMTSTSKEELKQSMSSQVTNLKSQLDSAKTALVRTSDASETKANSAIIADLNSAIKELENVNALEKLRTSAAEERAKLLEAKIEKFRSLF